MGATLARRLEDDPEFEYVAGLDTRRPALRLDRTEFICADIRDPAIATVVPATKVDTIVHNQIVRRPGPGMSSAAMHDVNVIGSLQLLTACEKTDEIRNIVVRGSAGIYGAEPHAPQFYGEQMARLYPLRTRFQRDVGEIENLFATFSRRHPDVVCTMLRYQPAIGPSVDTQFARYLSLPMVPTHLGFDPRIQVVHEDDALEALVATVRRPVHGAVNVAGPGTIGLTRLLRLARRVPLPIVGPLFGSVADGLERVGFAGLSPDFRRLLRHGRGVDTTRLVEEVGYRPRYSTPMAVADYVDQRAKHPQPSDLAPAPPGP
jgi:UDP-glucose 4-epimerase